MAIVSTATVKKFLQVAHSNDDAFIEILIDAAQEWIEQEADVYFHDGDGAVTERLDGGGLFLWPTRKPLNSVTAITDVDLTETITEDVRVQDNRILRYADGLKWGAGQMRYQVTYDAGYDADDVPALFKTALLTLVYRAYWARGDSDSQSASGRSIDWAAHADAGVRSTLRRGGEALPVG